MTLIGPSLIITVHCDITNYCVTNFIKKKSEYISAYYFSAMEQSLKMGIVPISFTFEEIHTILIF